MCVCVCVCVYVCERECVQVNIACAFKGVIAFVRVSLQGMTYPLWENISGAGYTPVDGCHSGGKRLKKADLWLV